MSEQSSLTLTADADLRRDFLTEADNAQRAASEILADLMRDFVERQKEARAYDDFVRRKVERARFCGGRAGPLERGSRGRIRSPARSGIEFEESVIVLWMPEAIQDPLDILAFVSADNVLAAVALDNAIDEPPSSRPSRRWDGGEKSRIPGN